MKYMRIFLKWEKIFSLENIVLLQIYLRRVKPVRYVKQAYITTKIETFSIESFWVHTSVQQYAMTPNVQDI